MILIGFVGARHRLACFCCALIAVKRRATRRVAPYNAPMRYGMIAR